jgi:PAS domain S-box-containing protein
MATVTQSSAKESAKEIEALRGLVDATRLLADSDVIGVVFWDGRGKITEANEAFLQLLGFTRDEMLAGALTWRELTPAEYRSRDERALAEVEDTGKCAPFEKEFFTKTGERVPVLVGAARFNPKQSMTGAARVAVVIDLREQVRLREARDRLLIQEQQARMETELANARLMLLVAGSKRLSRTTKMEDVLTSLADLVVPGLADWSYVIHRGWNGGPVMMASTHGDPNKRRLLERLRGCSPDPDAPDGAPRVFRTGETACYSNITPEQLSPSGSRWPIVGTRDPELLHVIREIGMQSLLCVPIFGRRGVDAVMMLASGADPQRYDRDDIVLAQDLAARASVSLEHARLLAEALESVRVRDEFLAVAAHELRTPLTSLFLHVQVLERSLGEGKLDASAAKRGLKAADVQARRLAHLVDRLLDVTRLASNGMTLHTAEFDLSEAVRSVVAALAEDFQKARCAVEITAPGPVVGSWDRPRIEQVLTNLLSNAMKFGEGRPIQVRVDAAAATATVSIRDQGIGISSEDQVRIFGRFERAVSVRHFGGLGLGLYISAQILRAHGGSLRVESKPGQGALFVAELPRG